MAKAILHQFAEWIGWITIFLGVSLVGRLVLIPYIVRRVRSKHKARVRRRARGRRQAKVNWETLNDGKAYAQRALMRANRTG